MQGSVPVELANCCCFSAVNPDSGVTEHAEGKMPRCKTQQESCNQNAVLTKTNCKYTSPQLFGGSKSTVCQTRVGVPNLLRGVTQNTLRKIGPLISVSR